MNFTEAVRQLSDGNAVISQNIVNGQPKELVSECGAVFIKTPRSAGAKSDNYIFTSPSVEEILSDEWEVRK